MATILEFRRAAGPTSRVTELKDGVPGQIIIFPGVRIERQAYEGSPRNGQHVAQASTARAEEAALDPIRSPRLATAARSNSHFFS